MFVFPRDQILAQLPHENIELIQIFLRTLVLCWFEIGFRVYDTIPRGIKNDRNLILDRPFFLRHNADGGLLFAGFCFFETPLPAPILEGIRRA